MRFLILTLFLIYPFLLLSQTSGVITYQETVNLDIELPEGMEQFKDMIPSSTQFQKVLLFDEEATMYKDAPEEASKTNELSGADEEGGMQIKMEFDRPNNQMFYDLKGGKTIEKTSFMEKKFLIEGEPKRLKWKMTGEQKTILDYTCQQAIFKDTSKTVIAWFTSEIPIAAGPDSYIGLPGMILGIDVDNGKRTIIATEVEFKKIEEDEIKAPKKGKKITRESYDKIVEEKTKELQEEYGGSGNMIIKTRRGN